MRTLNWSGPRKEDSLLKRRKCSLSHLGCNNSVFRLMQGVSGKTSMLLAVMIPFRFTHEELQANINSIFSSLVSLRGQ